jgi:hypothetical protein
MARRVNARSLGTKRAVAAELARHGSGYVLAGAMGSAVALRGRGPRLGSADVVAIGLVAGFQPVIEWSLHRLVLHASPAVVAGRALDPGAAHRGHHQVPDDVGGALLGTRFAACDAIGVAALAGAIGRVAAGPAAVGTAIAVGEAGLLAYEWTHLLAHSGYRPHTTWFRQLRASHLRHHFRDDTANFGVTSRLGDRLFGTAV